MPPNSDLRDRRDCDPLHFLGQFVSGEAPLSFDVGASDGECAMKLLALGHRVTLVDARYDVPAMKKWVQMSLDLNGWGLNSEFKSWVRADPLDGDVPSLDDFVTSALASAKQMYGEEPPPAVGIVKLDLDSNDQPLELEVLRLANRTLNLASIIQVENDGWIQRGLSYEHDLLMHLCANGLQPYAIWPVSEKATDAAQTIFVNSEERCKAPHHTHMKLRENEVADLDTASLSKHTANFILEPLCICDAGETGGSLTNATAAQHAACAYQLAAVQTRSPAFEQIRARFGSCTNFPRTL
jgi:hypothetical protein